MRPPQLKTPGDQQEEGGRVARASGGLSAGLGMGMSGGPRAPQPAHLMHPVPPQHPHTWASPSPYHLRGLYPPLRATDEPLRPRKGEPPSQCCIPVSLQSSSDLRPWPNSA